MQNSAHGANDGVSKIMLALIFLPVVWMKRIDFTLGLGVVALGAGIVAKNTVPSIMILKLENAVTMPKTITMHYVVVKKQDSKKRTIVRVDIPDIVENVGNN